MASPSRSSLISKAHRVLKKHFKPEPNPELPILESLLYGCCLENAPQAKARPAYDALNRAFFDWNEVRVATVTELAEELSGLPEPAAAADRVRRILQHVFEARYAFDLEDLRKENLGVAVKKLEAIEGTDPYIVAFAVQNALDGHSIPVDRGLLECMHILGVITDDEFGHGQVPGMERAIPKSKGQEFAALVHELGASLLASPQKPELHKILLEINAEAKDRLPKRPRKDAAEPAKPEKHADRKAPSSAADKAVADKSAAKKSMADKPERAAAEKSASGKAAKKKVPDKGLAKRKPR
jgi:hypothetical protein